MWLMPPLRCWGLGVVTSTCLTLAGYLLALARILYGTGLVGSGAVNRLLRLGSVLSDLGLRTWRRAAQPCRSSAARDRSWERR
jgi:hypothetical protein